jgi:hypothetical protein
VLKVDQALVQSFINGAFGLPIAHENIAYTPVNGVPYTELLVLPNDKTAFSVSDTDETDGVFRAILRYPVDTGAIAAKTKADEIFNIYKIGSSISYSGQSVEIVAVSRQPGVVESGWYKIIISVRYRAFIGR